MVKVERVVLIGDSIRMGYQQIVQDELAHLADVWGPEANGGTSRNVLEHLDEWVISRDPDVVHLNCGLHDLRTEFGASEPAVPLDEYGENVAQILKQIQDGTAARLIWATTTPVNEEWHHRNKAFDRFEADVLAYNRRAREVATRLGVELDDLYAVIARAGRDSYLVPDGVHFTGAGYTLLGQAVAKVIRTVQ
jgi:lysophospholipase L1-like esterase